MLLEAVNLKIKKGPGAVKKFQSKRSDHTPLSRRSGAPPTSFDCHPSGRSTPLSTNRFSRLTSSRTQASAPRRDHHLTTLKAKKSTKSRRSLTLDCRVATRHSNTSSSGKGMAKRTTCGNLRLVSKTPQKKWKSSTGTTQRSQAQSRLDLLDRQLHKGKITAAPAPEAPRRSARHNRSVVSDFYATEGSNPMGWIESMDDSAESDGGV